MSDALIKHAFVSPFADGPDATRLQPSNWNAALLVSGGVLGQALVRDPASATGASWADQTGGILEGDPRLTDARVPLAHVHAPTDITGTAVITTDPRLSNARLPLAHVHVAADITGTAVLTADARLSDARAPLAHTQAWSTITATPTTLAGYGIVDAGAAATAAALATPRLINGVSFNGTADVTVPAAAGTLSGTTLAAGVTGAAQTWAGLQTFSGGAAIAGVMTTTVNGLAAVSADGAALVNTTPATAAIPVQASPRQRLSGAAWGTTGGASQAVDFFTDVLPATGTVASGSWRLGFSLAGAAAVYPLKVDTAGTVTLTGALVTATSVYAAANGAFNFNGRASLQSVSDGHLTIQTSAGTVGVRLKCDGLPAVASGFGTGAAVTAGSTPLAGSVNVGTGGVAVSGVIQFNGALGFPSAPFVVCMNTTTGAVVRATATTTQLTITAPVAFVAGDVIAWHCISAK